MDIQNNTNGTAPDTMQERTFTQEQVNAIVGKRLAEHKQQQEAELVKREQELNKREMSIKAKELLAEHNLPKELANVLRYESEADLVAAIKTIKDVKMMSDDGGKEYKVLEANRLPVGLTYDEPDRIAKAFGLEKG